MREPTHDRTGSGWLVLNTAGRSVIRTAWHDRQGCPDRPAGFLLFGDRPYAALEPAPGCGTCAGVLYTGYGQRNDLKGRIGALRAATRGERGLDRARVNALMPIIELLVPGIYLVRKLELEPYAPEGMLFWDRFGRRTEDGDQEHLGGSYGGEFLMPTQSIDHFRESQVRRYLGAMTCGERPAGIAMHLLGPAYALLDGHHKAAAYARLGWKVPCFTICQWTTRSWAGDVAHWGFGYHHAVALRDIPKRVKRFVKGLEGTKCSASPDEVERWGRYLATDLKDRGLTSARAMRSAARKRDLHLFRHAIYRRKTRGEAAEAVRCALREGVLEDPSWLWTVHRLLHEVRDRGALRLVGVLWVEMADMTRSTRWLDLAIDCLDRSGMRPRAIRALHPLLESYVPVADRLEARRESMGRRSRPIPEILENEEKVRSRFASEHLGRGTAAWEGRVRRWSRSGICNVD